jgi:hypothetical protein
VRGEREGARRERGAHSSLVVKVTGKSMYTVALWVSIKIDTRSTMEKFTPPDDLVTISYEPYSYRHESRRAS